MGCNDPLGVFYQAGPFGRIPQQPGSRVFQRRVVGHLDGSPIRNQSPGKRRKVFHVRTEEYRFSGQDRFDGVLATARGQAFADENNCGQGIPTPELAGFIQ